MHKLGKIPRLSVRSLAEILQSVILHGGVTVYGLIPEIILKFLVKFKIYLQYKTISV